VGRRMRRGGRQQKKKKLIGNEIAVPLGGNLREGGSKWEIDPSRLYRMYDLNKGGTHVKRGNLVSVSREGGMWRHP